MKTRDIIKKIFSQAENGIIKIGKKDEEWIYYLSFRTNLKDSDNENLFTILNVSTFEKFTEVVSDYLNIAREFYKKDKTYFLLDDDSFDEMLFFTLLINASYSDLSNMIKYVKMRTIMLQKNIELKETIIGHYSDFAVSATISKNRCNLESPYRFEIKFSDNEGNKFILPYINFGIADDGVYLYCIQNSKINQKNEISKKLDRHFRKINKGVETQDFISNVSTNFLVSFTIFSSYMRSIGQSKIINPTLLPLRYEETEKAGIEKAKKRKLDPFEFSEKHDQIQYNITNKMINLFFRYKHHFNNNFINHNDFDKLEISLLPSDELLERDNIIYQIDNINKINSFTKE